MILAIFVVVGVMYWALPSIPVVGDRERSMGEFYRLCAENVTLRRDLEQKCSDAGGRGIVISKDGPECISQATMLPKEMWLK